MTHTVKLEKEAENRVNIKKSPYEKGWKRKILRRKIKSHLSPTKMQLDCQRRLPCSADYDRKAQCSRYDLTANPLGKIGFLKNVRYAGELSLSEKSRIGRRNTKEEGMTRAQHVIRYGSDRSTVFSTIST